MTEKRLKFDKYKFFSIYNTVLTVIMIVSFVAAADFIFSFIPPNPGTYVNGKTPVLPYIAATTSPNVYRWLAMISFLIGIISLFLLALPILKSLLISRLKNDSLSIENENNTKNEFLFDEPHEIENFIEFIYYQLVSQNKKKLALELRQYSGIFYTPSSEDLYKLNVLLNKILQQEDISLDEDTKGRIIELIKDIDKEFVQKG